MKKILTAMLTAALCLSFAACAAGAPDRTSDPSPAPVDPAGTPEPAEPAPISQPLPAEPEPETVWTVPEGITVSLLQEAYPAGTGELTLVLDNGSELELGYGEEFSCQKYVDGAWQDLDFQDRLYFIDVLYTVQPHSVRTMTLHTDLLARPLDEGLYRLTGRSLWIGGDEKTPGWQVDFRVTQDAQPEPDYALYISSSPIPTVQGCVATDRLPVHFINTTGEDGYVLDIPHLERQDEGDWAEVPYREGIGFCGTPSSLPAGGRNWSEGISALWGSLDDGIYRLSYAVGADSKTEDIACGTFTLYTPEENQGLPVFSGIEVFKIGEEDSGMKLSGDDSSAILDILHSGTWAEGTADCLNDYRLVVSGKTVYDYHSDCGTFNDAENNRSLTVSEEDRAAILAMLQ